jgi:SPP1 family phage portal protein
MELDVFRLSAGKELTPERLAKYIAKNDAKSVRYRRLLQAYNNDYEIFHQRNKPQWKPDHRLAVNFAQFIVDTFEGFFLGHPIKVTSKEPRVADYVNFLDAYNDQDDKNAELSRLVSIFGRAYELYYTDEDGVECISYLDPIEAFMIYDDAIDPHPRYFVRTYKDEDGERHGSISDTTTVRYFDYRTKVEWTSEPEDHHFDGVPATEYIQNISRRGIFENVLSLINGYNRTLSEKMNDVDYFSNSNMKVLGAKIDEETMHYMRDHRIINFAGKGASDLVVEFMQKPDGDNTQEHLLDRIENLIFITAMVVNLADDTFSNTSGTALEYKLLPMMNLAKTKERKFTSGLNRRYRMLFSNPVSGQNLEDWTTLEYQFTMNLPEDVTGETEAAAKLSGITSRKTQLKYISKIDDIDAELAQIAKEQDGTGYETDYPTERTATE